MICNNCKQDVPVSELAFIYKDTGMISCWNCVYKDATDFMKNTYNGSVDLLTNALYKYFKRQKEKNNDSR